MLELKAAASQNPVLPSANAAAPAPSKSERIATENRPTPAETPFAAALRQQQQAHAGRKEQTAKTDKTAEAAETASAQQAAAAVPSSSTDSISLLAPMLPGIGLPQSTASDATDGDVVAEDGESADAGVVIAMAAPAIAVVAPPTAAATGSSATPSAPAGTTVASAATAQSPDKPILEAAAPAGNPVNNLPRADEKSLPVSANIAATVAAAGEGKANQGTDQAAASFDTLLTTARDAHATNTQVAGRMPQSTPAPASATVSTPMGAPGWDQEVGNKLTWMVGKVDTRAELVLNPPHLGRVEVSVTMNGDQATATFASANPSVREALENAMPRLREILQGAGITLGDAQVGAESFRQSAEQRENGDNPARGRGLDADGTPHGLAAGDDTGPTNRLQRGNGLVDTFA